MNSQGATGPRPRFPVRKQWLMGSQTHLPLEAFPSLLNLMCGNSEEINLQGESEVRGGQGNRVLQEQRWE